MKYIRMIVFVLLFILTACSQTASTDTPAPSSSESPSSVPIATPMPEPNPSPSGRAAPQQGPAHPIPYISDIRLYPYVELFTLEDIALGPVAITSTQEDVTKALGEPARITNNPFHALGVMQTYHYPDCRIDFILIDSAYVLQRYTVTGGDQTTPRGIGVGATVRDTVLAYVDRIERSADNRAIFYRSNAGSDSPVAVPPSGVIFRDDTSGEWILQFTVPVESNPYAGYTQAQIEEQYAAMWFYTLRFAAEHEKVTRIDMILGHYIE